MIAEIVSIGTELLMGQIVNTDAQYLSRRLNALGISVYYHTTVGDNPGRMEQTLRLALSRSDVVITTGGLGPTGDDLSKEIVARMLHLPMERDEESMRRIEGYFSAMHRDMTHNNERQAMFARGAIILQNDRGTAPGCIVEQDGKAVIQLPGPPYELTDMFEKRVLPYLARRTGGAIASRYIRIFGVGESDAETRVKDLIDAQGDGRLAGGFGPEDLDDAALGDAAHAQRRVEHQAARGDDLDVVELALGAQLHQRALAKLLFNARQGDLERLFLLVVRRGKRRGLVTLVLCRHRVFSFPAGARPL